MKLEKIFSEKDLALDFNTAKIIASPYDYKLSERLMIHDLISCCRYFNIFNKGNATEQYLCNLLSLAPIDYMQTNKDVPLTSKGTPSTLEDTERFLDAAEKAFGYAGTFIKYNNLILNEEILLKDYEPNPYRHLRAKSHLKALEVLFLMMTAKSSLIPNLMYLATEFKDRSLDEIENIKFAEESIEKGEAPLIESNRNWTLGTPLKNNQLFDGCLVPMSLAKPLGAFVNEFHTLGLVYSIIYGVEILYYYDKITQPEIKQALEFLFSIDYPKGSFCEKYLYSFDSSGNLEINPEIKGCFVDDNDLRFDCIRALLSKVLKDADFSETHIFSKLDYFSIPTFFAREIINAHVYAYQIARVKHATLLYKRAKDAGLINKENFNEIVSANDGLFGYSTTLDTDDVVSNELIDLSTFSTTDDSKLSDEDLIEKEKSVEDKRKESPPMLNAADMLKKDLHDSRYSFDINYVKNNVSNKDAYNAIASNIKMITHELSRQIKEIKTYNTGGKQGGLLVGKLDKKNLWRYKTDPHIFYNNNYKLSEMDLAFGCILDESGSMGGEKIKNGRIVMIMLHEVLNSLGINHSIIGHTSSGMYQSKIFKYFQFKEEAHYSLDKPYGLVKADNRSGNCDSGALFYMQSVMKQVRNKDKIVIIFSDGQPTECTDLDLTEQVRNMEKNGIHVIGVGINFSSIREYYPDNANGKNLKEMVDIVVSILKRYVLEKKE